MLIYTDLDFYSSIKLVNYIRDQVKAGNLKPDVSSAATFEDNKYLQPTLEDDALLFSLDDLPSSYVEKQNDADRGASYAASEPSTSQRIAELERQLASVHSQFSEYRLQVEETLEKRWNDAEGPSKPNPSASTENTLNSKSDGIDFEGDYFESYSYNGIPVVAYIS